MNIFIKKPIIAIVISLLIVLVGLICFTKLHVRQFPMLKITTVTINTLYPGANPKKVQSFVTKPLEEAVASSDGIDHMTASSSLGESSITVYLRINYDPSKALIDITSKVNAVRYLLPTGVEDPSIEKQTGESFPSLIVSFTSKTMNPAQISAYLAQVIRPALQNINGLAFVNIFGNQPYALRVWLNPIKMLAHNVSASDVFSALSKNNVLSSPGQLRGLLTDTGVNISTDLHLPRQFKNIVIRRSVGNDVHLGDVARVEIGKQDYDSSLVFNGKKAVNLAFLLQPGANPITVISKVRKDLNSLRESFPPGLHEQTVHDSTIYIKHSLEEVVKALVAAIIIVIAIIFLFLGSFRLMIIPAVVIPLSLIGSCIFIFIAGFSINTLTLLAMILAIGLVVDDAIVMLENIHRIKEPSKSFIQTSTEGSKQVLVPIITMSLTLAVVFAPIALAGGLTGALFKEFAFTLSIAVIMSGIVAIILTPMMCSRLLNDGAYNSFVYKKVDNFLNRVRVFYFKVLNYCFKKTSAIFVLAVVILAACFFFAYHIPKTLAPREDHSYLGISAVAPSDASLHYLQVNSQYLENTYKGLPGMQKFFILNGFPDSSSVSSGIILKPISSRKHSQAYLAALLQNKLAEVPGLKAFVFQLPSLPMAGGGPSIQFVIKSTLNHKKIYSVAQEIIDKARQSNLFAFIDQNLRFDNPEYTININRKKAADLGISMEQIDQAISTLWSNNYVNYFSYYGYGYQVIPQADQQFRSNKNALQWIYVRSKAGILVPLSNIVSTSDVPTAASLNQFQQMNSVTIQGVLAKNVTIGDALNYLQKSANSIMPPQMSYDYSGSSRAFIMESHKLGYLIGFALLLIYLLLSLQFDSFSIPVVVLISVPTSLFGALLVMYLGAATMNIYTEIGLLALIGLISKHGILLVDFAIKKMRQGYAITESIIEAAGQRLRPILMTTAAMIFGVVPLIFSVGAGSNSRFDLGIVIFFGMLIGTFFTLIIIPVLLRLLMSTCHLQLDNDKILNPRES